MIQSKILEDSISAAGKRITTYVLTYPRFIHAEFMTHRLFSRNASSSRAIPVKKLIKDGFSNMAMPVYWGANRPGMQAKEELVGLKKRVAKLLWRVSGYSALTFAYIMSAAGAHKQTVNRIIEPWTHITVVVTATEWDNFFQLRDHSDAQPEIQKLASMMRLQYSENKPKLLAEGEWHLPFVLIGERSKFPIETLLKISAARCARVSYLLHDGKNTTVEKDMGLYEALVGSVPLHASPIEHQAKPDTKNEEGKWNHPEKSGNFVGWIQNRKLVEDTFIYA